MLLSLAMLWASMTHAQESINASGGNATGSGGSVAYSVGIVVYTTEVGSNGSMAQGVQHTFPSSKFVQYRTGNTPTTSSVESALAKALTAYPNPTSSSITLQLSEQDHKNLSFQMFDIEGKLLNSGRLNKEQTIIRLDHLPSATYKMNVLNQENQPIKTFQIIKN